MAEQSVSNLILDSDASKQVLAAGGVSKKRRDLTGWGNDKSRKPHSKARRQRACTPEPPRKTWTDESEDISETEEFAKRTKDPGTQVKIEDMPKIIPRSRTLGRTKEKEAAVRRTRSAERAPAGYAESETDDFEIIRSMHKSKALEEEAKAEKLETDAKIRVKEKPKESVQKEMPPLIEAPPELRKRGRHKSIPVQEHPVRQAPKTRMTTRRWSTSEDDDEEAASKTDNKGKSSPKPKSTVQEDSKPEKKVKKVARRAARSEKEEKTEENGYENEGDSESGSDFASSKSVKVGAKASISSDAKLSFLGRWLSWGKTSEDNGRCESVVSEAHEEKTREEVEKNVLKAKEVALEEQETEKNSWFLYEAVQDWKAHVESHTGEYHKIMRLRNRCISQLLLVIMYCGFGGIIFRFTEGAFESFYKCGVKRVKRDFIDSLWSHSQYMLEEEWKSQARRKLMEFENQLHAAHEAGMTTYSGQKSWSFLNSVVYCLTVITTIGYGHISPSTTTGRAITIIYAIFGIPMFLILLADFGKLFTRGIKFLWAFVRRLYYTGSCRKVRKTAPVQEVMKGVQLVYDFAKNRRPSQWGIDGRQQQQGNLKAPEVNAGTIPETPGTPNLSTFEIDDEFNLPISVAITILLVYIFFGATIYWTWEEWSFFESFYFVFISMSTIGFGDFVPQHPAYMMASIIYLVFGLALTSMCINVVQEKLSDTFRQASTKIGATIGLKVAEDGTLSAPAELADVNPMQNINRD